MIEVRPPDVRCDVCDGPFDDQAWRDRHAVPDGTTSRGVTGDFELVHADCCPICQGGPA